MEMFIPNAQFAVAEAHRHVKQKTQAWHRARHSEVTVAMLIGPPETLRSCSPMLGETTPKNHSAVKKVVPKIRTF